MAQSVFLFSTLITGVALLLVMWFATRERPVRRSLTARLGAVRPSGGGGTQSGERAAPAPVSGILIAIGLLAVLLLGAGMAVGVAAEASALVLFSGVLAGLVGVYLVWGIYHIARLRGLQYSQAVGLGVWFLGLLLLVGIAARLMLA